MQNKHICKYVLAGQLRMPSLVTSLPLKIIVPHCSLN